MTTNLDVVDFNDGVLSLREAIFVANTSAGADEINFDFGHDGPETIVLRQRDLVISSSLVIRGPGAELLTIDASGSDPTPDVNDARGSRVFTINNGNASLEDVELWGLTLTGGDSGESGGAILAMENLVVTSSVITGNSTRGGGFAFGGGGGIFSYPAAKSNPNALVIRESMIEGNSVEDLARKEGGGIRKQYGSLIISRTTIAGNRATWGGGISAADGNIKVQIRDSTISGNTSVAYGGGLMFGVAVVDISGSTISGNRAGTGGGGIRAIATTTLRHTTVTGNVTSSGMGGLDGSATLDHSIIAGNFSGTVPNDVYGGAARYSLIGVGDRTTNSVGSLIGTSAAPIDPLLSPLADNGGPTKTHALLPGSPAIDAGDGTVRGPVAYYRFEEAVGASLAEDFAGANEGTYHGDPALEQSGILNAGGKAISFDGVDDYASIPRAVANDFTYSMWVKTSASSSTPMALVGGDVAGTTADYQFSIEAGRFKVQIGTMSFIPSMLINDGKWHHLAVTRKATGGATRVYIDGTLHSPSGNGTSGALAAASELRIGQLLNGQQSFAGQMDELAVYDRVLSDLEVRELATTGVMLFDQRGEPFGRTANWDTIGEARSDMGSYERRAIAEFGYVVDSLSDGADDNPAPGHRSLREAVYLANLHPGVDTITFAPELTAGGPGTIQLDAGELAITEPVVIDGPGADLLTVDAQERSRVFHITATTGDFEINGLTLAHGKTTGSNPQNFSTHQFSGGAVRSMTTGTLSINNARIAESSTTGARANGGGVFAIGPIVLNHSVVSGNTTTGEFAYGGGVASRNSVSLTESAINGNQVLGRYALGGGVWALGDVNSTRSAILQNRASNNSRSRGGGGISASNVNLHDSTVRENVVFGPPYTVGATGGGIRVTGGTVTITGSLIADNRATSGGGGVHGSTGSRMVVESSTISGNNAGGGGGLSGDVVSLSNSTVSGNSAERFGGGIYGRSITAVQSTITNNHATSQIGDGGGIFGSVTARGSIIAGNSATSLNDDVAGNVTLDFSLLGNNVGALGAAAAEAPVGSPDARGNLIGGPMHGTIDPKLGPLVKNGGPTLPDGSQMLTHALLPGSPAINAGDPAAVAGVGGVPQFDQRGLPWSRVAGGRIDMGAVESQANPLGGDYNFDGVVDAADYSVWRDMLGSTTDLRADGSSATTPGAPDGVVDQHDYAWWKANFGNVMEQGAGSREPGVGVDQGVVQLNRGSAAVGGVDEFWASEEKITAGDGRRVAFLAGVGTPASVGLQGEGRASTAWQASRGTRAGVVHRDAALLAWAARRSGGEPRVSDAGVVGCEAAKQDGGVESLDAVFAGLGVGLRE